MSEKTIIAQDREVYNRKSYRQRRRKSQKEEVLNHGRRNQDNSNSK